MLLQTKYSNFNHGFYYFRHEGARQTWERGVWVVKVMYVLCVCCKASKCRKYHSSPLLPRHFAPSLLCQSTVIRPISFIILRCRLIVLCTNVLMSRFQNAYILSSSFATTVQLVLHIYFYLYIYEPIALNTFLKQL